MINLIEFIPFLTPIPAMAIFHFRTRKLNILTIPFISSMFIGTALLYLFNITLFGLYTSELIFNYSIMLTLGLLLFRLKYDFLQALSIAYCILFVNIFFWEIPIYIYTFSQTGQFAWYSQLAPLALFPATHIYKHVEVINKYKAIFLFALGLFISALFLIPIHANGWVIWISETIAPSFPSGIINIMWFINRTACYLVLARIFFN